MCIPDAQGSPGIIARHAKKRSRTRIFLFLSLLSLGTMINYLDRTILGIVAPKLTTEIHIDPAMMGIVFFRFLPGLMRWRKFPGGMFLDRFGNKLTYALSIFFLVSVYAAAKLLAGAEIFAPFCVWARASVKPPAFRPIAASSANGFPSMNGPGLPQLIRLVNTLG